MATLSETSDQALLELLRRRGPMTIAELTSAMEVTANAVRQRLARLTGQGLISRTVGRIDNPPYEDGAKPQRGRPNHRYGLTEKARRQVGDNFADLPWSSGGKSDPSRIPKCGVGCSSVWPMPWPRGIRG